MTGIPNQIFLDYIPAFLSSSCSCICFHDQHPIDDRKVDLIICSEQGEIIELFDRSVQRSIRIDFSGNKIETFRNERAELFYLVSDSDKLAIISAFKANLELVRTHEDVEKYVMEDDLHNQKINIKIWFKDSITPEKLDCTGDFQILVEYFSTNEPESTDDYTLSCKLSEARYNLAHSQKKYEEIVKIKNSFIYGVLQKSNCSKKSSKNLAEDDCLVIEDSKPWLTTLCNSTVMGIKIRNKSNRYKIKEIRYALSKDTPSTITYGTHLFKECIKSPFWESNQKFTMEPNEVAILTVVVPEEVFSEARISGYFGCVLYTCCDNLKQCHLDEVEVKCKDVALDTFDVFKNIDENDTDKTMISIMSAMQNYKLKLTPLTNELCNLQKILCEDLEFQQLQSNEGVVVHLSSPYHPLAGVTVVLGECCDGKLLNFTVYTRNIKQVILLVQTLYTTIHQRIVITTSNKVVRLKSDADKTQPYDQSMDIDTKIDDKVLDFAEKLCDESSRLLEYLDDCMVAMHNSKDPDVLRMIGEKIDLLAMGKEKYEEFQRGFRTRDEELSKILDE